MRINFFEEFPIDKNLNKLKLINFNCSLYVAAKSFKEFESLKENIVKTNPKIEVAYWPILEKSYWISPFSYSYELKNLYNDLFKNKQEKPLKILIDLEPPLLNKKLFFFNFFSFFRNKKIIKKFFKESRKLNLDILTSEYPVLNRFVQKKLEWLGISYSIDKYPHKKIVMFYSSMIKSKFLKNKIKGYIQKRSQKLGKNLQIGLGTIAIGILGNELILAPRELDKDLTFCKKQNIDTIVIFRLGGLNKDYIKIIKKYL